MQALDVTLYDITNPQEYSLFANSLFFLGRQMYYKSTMKLTEGAICLTNYSQNNYTFILIPASSAF